MSIQAHVCRVHKKKKRKKQPINRWSKQKAKPSQVKSWTIVTSHHHKATERTLLQVRPLRAPHVNGQVEAQVGILHLEAELPAAQAGPEVGVFRVTGGLGNVEPAEAGAAAVLVRGERAPGVGAGELAAAASAPGQRRHDERGVEAEAVDPAGGEGEGRHEADGRPGGLEEGDGAGLGLGGVAVGVVGVDLDGDGAAGAKVPVEAGEVFGGVPVCAAGEYEWEVVRVS